MGFNPSLSFGPKITRALNKSGKTTPKYIKSGSFALSIPVKVIEIFASLPGQGPNFGILRHCYWMYQTKSHHGMLRISLLEGFPKRDRILSR
ncbi:hypothetical protein GGTG_04076 [Gaeumannomyces tritici R3-111a-1]|uniref:Uncharacterized protein n=1 Tax=Gaeumannomyces tritici (strain R3-111a-1) TaxID=644352 RepID=J3NS29_GAET3|nr:hypothetical protein GGTG_04076 [Gaeumannomyces tritici R3-111a-1]EJT78985.1 hypothetical protein GGTG_04076 [Gaeumannomyces tritici R3-111a-1]